MDQLACLAQHKMDRDSHERAALAKFGKMVYHLHHILHCQETTDECAEKYRCALLRTLLGHMRNCAGCDNEICRDWKCVWAHMDVCEGAPCDLCAWKWAENPLDTDDTYDEEQVQNVENLLDAVEEDRTNLCCKIS